MSKSIFFDKYNVSSRDLETYLAEALSRGGDYADIYFEYRINHSIVLEEQIIKSATKSINIGAGVRVISGEKTGYAYSDSLERDHILKAARTAAFIANASSEGGTIGVPAPSGYEHGFYSTPAVPAALVIAEKIILLDEADQAARSYDARIHQVQASYVDETKHVLIATSDGRCTWDLQPLVRLNVTCIAEENGQRQSGYQGGGGRRALDVFTGDLDPKALAREAARQALLQLRAGNAPAGPMEVVLGPGWPGILLHEAIGHGLEADFNRKKTSAFAGLIGQKVASELCTVVDDGTIPFRRGSLNMDDEGNPTHRTVLIEKGVLQGYLQDRLSATLMKAPLTGNGRRQGYDHIPMPRMTNTFMVSGESAPEDIIKSVRKGLYAVHFGGGQVDITSGKFVFSASEAYLIEGGRITSPVKGATLIGDGPTVLRQVTAVGNDLALDHGVGICGKDGQTIPVSVGLPTIKIREITVGGTEK
ncbi:MAG: metalloprotease TldD [Acidobacteria bacterium]|nr:MAG: metalloprotease TldD [Acidobacteriota bacterium]